MIFFFLDVVLNNSYSYDKSTVIASTVRSHTCYQINRLLANVIDVVLTDRWSEITGIAFLVISMTIGPPNLWSSIVH